MQQAQVALATLGKCLVVEEHRCHGALRYAVPIVIEAVRASERIVVVPRHHHPHIRVRGDDLIKDALRDRTEPTGRQHEFMQVDDCDAVRVSGQHLIHPFNFRVPWSPALVDGNEVDTSGGEQIEVSAVVLI